MVQLAGSVPEGPETPFLRPVGEEASIPALPDGWNTHPAGSIAGDLVEVAFDPHRHDVTIMWDSCIGEPVADAIHPSGWERMAHTDSADIWTRDRLLMASRSIHPSAGNAVRGLAVGR